MTPHEGPGISLPDFPGALSGLAGADGSAGCCGRNGGVRRRRQAAELRLTAVPKPVPGCLVAVSGRPAGGGYLLLLMWGHLCHLYKVRCAFFG